MGSIQDSIEQAHWDEERRKDDLYAQKIWPEFLDKVYKLRPYHDKYVRERVEELEQYAKAKLWDSRHVCS